MWVPIYELSLSAARLVSSCVASATSPNTFQDAEYLISAVSMTWYPGRGDEPGEKTAGYSQEPVDVEIRKEVAEGKLRRS